MFRKLAVSAPAYARSYVTPKELSVDVPLTLHGIDGRYATSLFTAAFKKNVLSAVEADIKAVQAAVAKDPALRSKLADPTRARDFKDKGAIQALLGGIKIQSPLISNLLGVLAENSRLHETERVADGFVQLMAAHRGEISVTVISAKDLDQKILNRIETALAKGELSGYKTINVKNKVNPSIVGGLIVEYGDKTIDLSVSSRVSKLDKVVSESI